MDGATVPEDVNRPAEIVVASSGNLTSTISHNQPLQYSKSHDSSSNDSGSGADHLDEDAEGEFGGLDMPDVHVLLDMKESTIQRLQNDLRMAQLELKSKDEKCGRLEEMQGKVDSEIHELTASLFQVKSRMYSTLQFRNDGYAGQMRIMKC